MLLLVIGVAVTELAVWGRREHAAASRRAGYLDGIGVTVEAVAAGEGPSELIDEVSGQLTRVLSLRSCRWQYGVAGLGHPARLKHNGQVTARDLTWDVVSAGLPPDTETELLVENGGLLQGRFLLTPVPGTRPTREQLLVGHRAGRPGGRRARRQPPGRPLAVQPPRAAPATPAAARPACRCAARRGGSARPRWRSARPGSRRSCRPRPMPLAPSGL